MVRLFDVEKYEIPAIDKINWKETKMNVGIFLSAYKTARERVGLPMLPKLTTVYHLTNEENSWIQSNEGLNAYEEYRSDFLRLNKLFILGRFGKYDLAILDELGYVSFDQVSSEILFNLLSIEQLPVL